MRLLQKKKLEYLEPEIYIFYTLHNKLYNIQVRLINHKVLIFKINYCTFLSDDKGPRKNRRTQSNGQMFDLKTDMGREQILTK